MKTITSDRTVAPIGSTIHTFEQAGLGKAPFRFVRFEVRVYQACPGAPVQPGSTCDYCGTAIMNLFWIKGKDGNEFKVGCDCVEKTNDAGLRKVVDIEVRKHQRARKAELDGMKIAEVNELVKREDVRQILSSRPHPFGFTGKSELDYCEWICQFAGTTGKIKLLKIIKKIMDGS